LGIATDGAGGVYITGYYTAAVMSVGSNTLPNSGGQDMFLAKFDGSGSVQWAKRAGGANNDLGYTVAADKEGYSYVAGWFLSNSIGFGSVTLANVGAAPYSDLFITSFDPAGNVAWAKGVGSSGMDVANGVALDGGGNCYLTGTFHTPVTFGTNNVTPVGGSDIFVAKTSVARPSGMTAAGTPTSGHRIYPNPVWDKLHFSRNKTFPKKQTLRVFNVTGQMMASGELVDSETSIDVQAWPAGIYSIRIDGEWSLVVKQ
jgi:hypothetical protein